MRYESEMIGHELRMRKSAHSVREIGARCVERSESRGDLSRHGLRRADVERPVRSDLLVERRSRGDTEASFAGDS
jgi:hypothetical protein